MSSPVPEPSEEREHVSYQQVYDQAVQYSAWMRGLGIKMGDRIAVGGGNQTGWVVCWLAALLIGAVPVLLNATL